MKKHPFGYYVMFKTKNEDGEKVWIELKRVESWDIGLKICEELRRQDRTGNYKVEYR